jgi:hypothetical protein
MIDPTERGAAETVPETSCGPMEPIEASDPVYAGNPCWIWHRLWECGPQIGFWDAAQKWWQITNGKLDDYGMVRKDGAFGVGIFPSHWSSLNNVPLHHRVKGWGWMPGDDQPTIANTRLTDAVLDLLEALARIRDIPTKEWSIDTAHCIARAAIAKATGYSSALAALNAETNEMVALSNGRLG